MKGNHAALAQVLARPHYLDQPAAAILPALRGDVSLSRGAPPEPEPDFLLFHRNDAGFPAPRQARWIYEQLVRWGLADAGSDHAAAAEAVFRGDIYRRALPGRAAG